MHDIDPLHEIRRWAWKSSLAVIRPLSARLYGLTHALRHQILLRKIEMADDDIFIVTYPRSGTTLVQMIAHQLRCGPDGDFVHIDQVVPFFDRVHLLGIEATVAWKKLRRPRFFKTHLRLDQLPQHCRYIYVARDPHDVALSFYEYLRSGRQYANLDGFLSAFVKGELPWGSWAQHVDSATQYSGNPRVLFLTYEALRSDLEGCVRRIAAFAGIRIEESDIGRILERCSFQYMQQREQKFDPALCDLTPEALRQHAHTRATRPSLTPSQSGLFPSKVHEIKAEVDHLAAQALATASLAS